MEDRAITLLVIQVNNRGNSRSNRDTHVRDKPPPKYRDVSLLLRRAQCTLPRVTSGAQEDALAILAPNVPDEVQRVRRLRTFDGMQVRKLWMPGLQLRHEVCVGRDGVGHAHALERAPGRDTDSGVLRAHARRDRIHYAETKPRPVLDGPSVCICSNI